MKDFVQNLTKTDSFFKNKQNIVIKDISEITTDMLPVSASIENAQKFLSMYDKAGNREKVLLTYRLLQSPKGNAGPRAVIGYQVYIKFHNDLYVILDRVLLKTQGSPGQLLIRYIDSAGKSQGSVSFFEANIFDGLSEKKYNIEIHKLMAEHDLDDVSAAEDIETLFVFN